MNWVGLVDYFKIPHFLCLIYWIRAISFKKIRISSCFPLYFISLVVVCICCGLATRPTCRILLRLWMCVVAVLSIPSAAGLFIPNLFLIFTLLENKIKFQTHKQIFNPEFSNTRKWSRLMLSSLSSVCLPVSYSYFIWHLFKLFFYVLCLLIISFSRTPSRFFSCCGFIYVYLRNTAGGGTRDDEMMCLMIFGFYLYIAGVYGDVHRVKILFNKKDTALIQMAEPHQAQLGNGTKVGCWTLLANDSFCVFLLV